MEELEYKDFEASFHSLLRKRPDVLDQEQKNNLKRLLRHFVSETPEQQNFVGGDDGLEPAAEGAKIGEPVSNDIVDAVTNNIMDSTGSDILKLDDDDVLTIDRDAFTANIKRDEAPHVTEAEPH
ncbi:MAG: hypothetical protein Q9173_000621 [Seirophora scorigena]